MSGAMAVFKHNDAVREPFVQLQLVCARGDLDSIRRLLDGDAEMVNREDEVGVVRVAAPSLPAARQCGVWYEGASGMLVVQFGETPLHVTARYDKPDAAELLLTRGADLEARNKVRRTCGCTTAKHVRCCYREWCRGGRRSSRRRPCLWRAVKATTPSCPCCCASRPTLML